MSEGIVHPGDRVPWNEETVELDINDKTMLALANMSLETGLSLEDLIVEALKKQAYKKESV